jgi:hypothetical protein
MSIGLATGLLLGPRTTLLDYGGLILKIPPSDALQPLLVTPSQLEQFLSNVPNLPSHHQRT